MKARSSTSRQARRRPGKGTSSGPRGSRSSTSSPGRRSKARKPTKPTRAGRKTAGKASSDKAPPKRVPCSGKAPLKKRRKKKAKAKRAPEKKKAWLDGKQSRRQRYCSPAHYEIVYQAWREAGNVTAATRVLKQVEGFEDIDRRTVNSIFLECREDWERRLAEDVKAIEIKTREKHADEIATLEVKARRNLAKMFDKLAALSVKMMPAALRKIALRIEKGKLGDQELVYGTARLMKEMRELAKPAKPVMPGSVTLDQSKHVHLNTPPSETAKVKTRAELDAEYRRLDNEYEQRRLG